MNQCYQFKESLAKHFWKLFPKLARDKTDTGLDGPFQSGTFGAPEFWCLGTRTLVPPTFLVLVFLDVYAGSCWQCSDNIIGDT